MTATSLLENIDSPRDLKGLDTEQLEQLAKELRQYMLKVVSRTGGHLAPNLGVVELTLALHFVFDSPADKIVFDVGHQSYVHKILTGRREAFATLRQYGGLSGFPKPTESPHDAFGTGHSSTSVSAALGLAIARDLQGEDYNVVAVIGDGSMTGGLAYEALNNAGNLKKRLIVILNDNEMSISKNVGAMSEYLDKLRTGETYNWLKENFEEWLQGMEAGKDVLAAVNRVKGSLKYLVTPGTVFEELGFKYFGPVDGHDLKALIGILSAAKKIKGPVLIHVLTKKGKGYAPAEENPDKFHGIGAFDLATGKKTAAPAAPVTYTEVFGRTLTALADRNEKIVAITAAMPDGTGLSYFAAAHQDRFLDVGIAEQHAVTCAAGLAMAGAKPVCAVYSTFAQRAYDNILHDVCLQNLPVVLCLDRAGLVGDDGPTHHGVFDLAYLGSLPNMTVMAPKDEDELRHMLYTALQMESPAAIRYPRGSGLGVPLSEELHNLPLGKAEVLSRGRDVMIWAIGSMVTAACQAANLLRTRNIDSGVVNMRFAKPLDKELLFRQAEEVGRIVTLEEGVSAGGAGSSVLAALNEAGLLEKCRVLTLGIGDDFVPHGDRALLLRDLGLDAEGVALSIEKHFFPKEDCCG